MFVDELHLHIPPNEQNLYTAYEIIQMKPLFQRNNTYENFLLQNKWIEKYLPNSIVRHPDQSRRSRERGGILLLSRLGSIRFLDSVITSLGMTIEFVFRSLQLWFMKRRRTTETIEEGRLKFHPQDIRPIVMQKYRQKLKKYGIEQ